MRGRPAATRAGWKKNGLRMKSSSTPSISKREAMSLMIPTHHALTSAWA